MSIMNDKVYPCKLLNSYYYFLHLRCDKCKTEFSRRTSNIKSIRNKEFHFCSSACHGKSLSSGLLRAKSKKIHMKKYGTEHSSQDETVKQKVQKTVLEKYGVKNISQSSVIKQAKIKTSLKNLGVRNPAQSHLVQKKMQSKCIERYGVAYPMQSKKVQEKAKKTNLEKYGVENPSQNKEIKNKVHETKKKNGSYGKSKAEDGYYKYLCLDYGKENIERQARINGWSIDFYIKSKNLYVQFDGVYYHGLDRPLEEVKEFKTNTDKSIYGTMLRDIDQNKWFKNNNMKLIRVREDNFKAGERLDV